jgi:hypothetical protein
MSAERLSSNSQVCRDYEDDCFARESSGSGTTVDGRTRVPS